MRVSGDTAWTIPDAGTRSVLMNKLDLFTVSYRITRHSKAAHPNDKYIKLLYNAKNRKIDIVYQAAIGTINRKALRITAQQQPQQPHCQPQVS